MAYQPYKFSVKTILIMLKNRIDIHKLAGIVIIAAMVLFIMHCKREEKVDLTGIEVDLKVERFEQDIFSIPFDSIANNIERLNDEYNGFFEIFNYAIIKIGDFHNKAYPEYLRMYLTDFQVNKIYDESQKVYADFSPYQDKLTDAFRYYKYYFPEKEVPVIFTFIGRDIGHASIAVDSGILAVAIDKYMGSTCELYYMTGFYQYMMNKMVPQRMVADCMRGWGISEFPFNDTVNDVLNNIIYEGKILYFTKKMLPNEPDTIVTGFTSDQLKFCLNNEYNMWNFLVENKMLFNTDYFTINKYIGEGPFTKDFTSESPARAAVWIGYRIVDSYMKKNPKTTLPELMNLDNGQFILERSGYNP
ncbi:MAG: hypothetical protein JXB49_35665 [Bacteroidales bacterium]|nr:hypothetical protein [Bacteroidales bacterium]